MPVAEGAVGEGKGAEGITAEGVLPLLTELAASAPAAGTFAACPAAIGAAAAALPRAGGAPLICVEGAELLVAALA